MRRLLAIVLALTCAASLVFSQPRPYAKKVVSFVNNVIAPSSASLSQKHRDFIGESVGRNMNLTRFNFAPLPDQCQSEFRDASMGWKDSSPDKVKEGIDAYLAPALLKIIDENKEVLSKQNLSEADRNTFLATKAKAAGLSASQLEAILNSGYFFVPYIESYSHNAERKVREEKDEKGNVKRRVNYTEYSHQMRLGVLWYQLQLDKSNKASVAFVGQAKGWNGSAISRSKTQDDGDGGDADWEVFSGVVDACCNNIALSTKQMEAFQLTGGVTETTGMGMMLSIGKREGVHLDDTYWIEEMQEDETGAIQKVRRGFVKVRDVADNNRDESAASYAQSITGSNYSPGLSASEVPLIGINALIAPAVMPVKIGMMNNVAQPIEEDHDYALGMVMNSEPKNAYGLMAAVQVSLAHAANVSELWFHLGAQGGILRPDGQFIFQTASQPDVRVSLNRKDIGVSLTGSINAGLLKKYYIKRFGFFLQADAKFAILRLAASNKPVGSSDDVDYTMINSNFGGDFRTGLEIYLSPKVMFGMAAEYNLFGASDKWTVKVTDKDDKELLKRENTQGPEVNFGGLGFYAWINFAIPSFH